MAPSNKEFYAERGNSLPVASGQHTSRLGAVGAARLLL